MKGSKPIRKKYAMKELVKKAVEEFKEEILRIRRHIHQHPELSFQETETSKYISAQLKEWGIEHKTGYVKTGILGKIEGKNPSKRVIALRADMDALPVQEENNVEYKSKNKGVMHACGHDVHSASLLGTAKILNKFKDSFEGTILLVFQPGEEKLPGGAKLMMEEGVFEELTPEIVIGQHVMPQYEVGKVGFKSGMYMASADEIYLTVKADGGHGALPHLLTDTVLVSSHIIVALQQVVSRNAPAQLPSVLSFGKFVADGATNVIPNEVKIEGTFRTMNEEWREEAHLKIEKMAKSVAEAMGAVCEVDIRKGYPCLVNHDSTTQDARSFAAEYLGEEDIIDMDIRMTGEDFSYFTQKYPSTFYRLGVKNDNKCKIGGLHTPTFNIDEDALEIGMGTMAYIALSFMNQ